MRQNQLLKELPIRLFLLFVLSQLIIFSVHSQTKITGQVLTNDDKPLEHATILLLNSKDSALVRGVLTDNTGKYILENIKQGSYLISASYTGLNTRYTSLFSTNNNTDKLSTGIIKLDSGKTLTAVTIVLRKPLYEQRIDRLVINVSAALTFTGISALDVLERSPGVIVNRVNNSLSINGKEGVIVMINGKRNYMDFSAIIQMLDGLPSGSVDKIEIITTPPANFDAEGNAGIINIVLKNSEQYGTNGSYTLSPGYNKGAQNSASININHREGKLNLFGNVSLFQNSIQQLWTNYHSVINNGILMESSAKDHRHPNQWQQNSQLGADYQLNKKTIIGVLLSSNYRHWIMTSLNDESVLTNHQLDTAVHITNHELHTTWYYGANINFQHTFKQDELLTFNADYLYYKDKNPNTYLNNYFDGSNDFLYEENVQSSKLTPLRFWIEALDYSKKLSKKVDMEAGLKSTISRSVNEVNVATLLQNNWVTDTSFTGTHTLHESIEAAYTSFNIKFSEKNSIKAGLRYEYTRTLINSLTQKGLVNRKYGELFPSFFYLHNFKEDQSLNFTYSRRIYRPGFNDLASWVIFLDPKTFETGNPDLQPSISDNLSVAYTLKDKIVTLSYSHASPDIVMEPEVDKTLNKVISTSQNSKNSQSATIAFALPFKINNWWNMQNNVTFLWQESNINFNGIITTKSSGAYMNSTQNFKLPDDFSISMSGFYSSKYAWGFYIFKPFGSLDVAAQKKWPKKKSSLSLNVTNVLLSETGRLYADIPSQNILLKTSNTYGYMGFTLSYTKNFGNEKVKQSRNRATGAEDEKNRGF